MAVICSSETSVDTQRTTWRYIPEDGTLHNHCCENLKSCTGCKMFSDISCVNPDGAFFFKEHTFVGSEVPAAAIMKITIYWEVTPCNSIVVH
jgi:hypothetical protein